MGIDSINFDKGGMNLSKRQTAREAHEEFREAFEDVITHFKEAVKECVQGLKKRLFRN